MSAPIRVLVADDEPLLRAGLRAVLEAAGDVAVVAEAGTGREAVDLADRHRPDVALLDVRMPDLDGLAAAEELRRRTPGVRVVMLTSFGTEPNVLRAVRGEAAGFVLKTCAPDELVRAVRAAHAGEAYLSPPVARIVLGLIPRQAAERRSAAAARLATLAPREADVLRLAAEGLPNADIARRLRMTETSVKTYMSRIMSKLDCANRVQAALLVRDAGV
ncbi:response regulator transcription factor [Rhizomonospora bruguierae]|uniref:response regulator transcription factor n=1 Tax=Rhizomonospora bruguierae TaxID=1581705 RepID=UPI001BCC4ADF|nr:response regulator transcription factor [Micromonospora sp. NBRC 107566]